MPPGDRPWAARSAGTHPGDVVTGAFLQTPVGGTPSGLRGAAIGLHVVDGKVAIQRGKAKSLPGRRKVRLSASLASGLKGSARSISQRGTRGGG